MIGDEERRRGAPLPVWSLIVLSLLREHRRLTVVQLCDFSHLEHRRIVSAVENLVEAGLVEGVGSGSSFVYAECPSVQTFRGAGVLRAPA